MSDLHEYDYDVPKHLIAQFPAPNRVDARLLLVDRTKREFGHFHIRDLPEILRPGDCLVLNSTRVTPARLLGERITTGGRWQGLFLKSDEQGRWLLLCKARGKLFAGEKIQLFNANGVRDIQIELVEKFAAGGWCVKPDSDQAALEVLERVGRVPLPHYIRGSQQLDQDLERYQTVYAKAPGSAAAPTAGLHFTKELLSRIRSYGVQTCEVTLHVGIDTFAPIKVQNIAEHSMHSEWCDITAETVRQIQATRAKGGRVIAIGTTSTRVLETAALSGELQPFRGESRLYIRPGHSFSAIDGMLTNFHVPCSTLLVMVRAFGGDSLMREAYETAIKEGYRFFSYGDAMLII